MDISAWIRLYSFLFSPRKVSSGIKLIYIIPYTQCTQSQECLVHATLSTSLLELSNIHSSSSSYRNVVPIGLYVSRFWNSSSSPKWFSVNGLVRCSLGVITCAIPRLSAHRLHSALLVSKTTSRCCCLFLRFNAVTLHNGRVLEVNSKF